MPCNTLGRPAASSPPRLGDIVPASRNHFLQLHKESCLPAFPTSRQPPRFPRRARQSTKLPEPFPSCLVVLWARVYLGLSCLARCVHTHHWARDYSAPAPTRCCAACAWAARWGWPSHTTPFPPPEPGHTPFSQLGEATILCIIYGGYDRIALLLQGDYHPCSAVAIPRRSRGSRVFFTDYILTHTRDATGHTADGSNAHAACTARAAPTTTDEGRGGEAGTREALAAARAVPRSALRYKTGLIIHTPNTALFFFLWRESGLLENEPTAPPRRAGTHLSSFLSFFLATHPLLIVVPY